MITLHCRPAGAAATEIRIGAGLAGELHALGGVRSTFAIVDERALGARPDLLPDRWHRLTVAGGEDLKTFAALERVLRAMAQADLDRASRLVAVGGGSVGDLGGLAAALFLRGIECWQVPTTLLAMVDAAVGGKTAINLPEGKNLVGAVHPPALVLVDLDFARALPEPAFRAGLAEVVKMALGCDADLFARLQRERDAVLARDPAVLTEVVRAALAAKIAIVEGDLRETGRRRVLNLGHTLGHALEAHGHGEVPHGLCVARGLHFALDVAQALDAIGAADLAAARALLAAYGYEPTPLPPAAELWPYLARDKKVEGTVVHFAVPAGIGRCEIRPLELAWLRRRIEP